jgi:hypothetical protein
MSIKLALLKSGETVIADMKELVVEEKVCGYLFNYPHKIQVNKTIVLTEEESGNNDTPIQITLSPWFILTSDTQIAVTSDWVVTVVNPLKSVEEIYIEKTADVLNQMKNDEFFTEMVNDEQELQIGEDELDGEMSFIEE